MAHVVSFNRDAPALKPKGHWSDGLFSMRISGDYLAFAGRRELRAWRVTASNGATAYSQEFNDKAALFGWLLDAVGFIPEDASLIAVGGDFVPLNFFMSEDDVRQLGFKEPGEPFTPPWPV
jgi:hypothetical protein